tara:strand:+ start:203 stop:1120 length:918 start_codon:yes stop_codon:yes gene_type:complete
MADKISEYPAKTVFNDDDLTDFSTTLDSGVSYTTEKSTLLQVVDYIKTKIQTLYSADGTVGPGRVVTLTDILTFKDGDFSVGDHNSVGRGSFYFKKNNSNDSEYLFNTNPSNGISAAKVKFSVKTTTWGKSTAAFGEITDYIELTTNDSVSKFQINKHIYNSHIDSTPLKVAFAQGSGSYTDAVVANFVYSIDNNYNDLNDRDLFGININTSLGSFTNSGVGISKNVGLNVLTGGGDVNYAAIFNGGNVGIGTGTPTEKLDVNGRQFLSNQTAPTTPTGGGTIFVESGALKYIGSSGTITTLGIA